MPVGPRWFSWWILPIIGSIVWVGTLVAMLVVWLCQGSPHYVSMASDQKIAYISDVGADFLKPLFIAGSSVTAVCFFLSLAAERWLRHSGRIEPNTSLSQIFFSIIAMLGAIVGSVGLVLLSIFDTKRHSKMHITFLMVFCAGILVSALGTVLEYKMLGHYHRKVRAVRISMWMKGVFFVIEFGLAVAFGVCMNKEINNVGAILEWVLAVVFTGYLISFLFDLLPAVRTTMGDLKDPEKHAFETRRHRKQRERENRRTNF